MKFNEKLRDAVEINVLGTKKVLDLVMGMKHLKVLLCAAIVPYDVRRTCSRLC